MVESIQAIIGGFDFDAMQTQDFCQESALVAVVLDQEGANFTPGFSARRRQLLIKCGEVAQGTLERFLGILRQAGFQLSLGEMDGEARGVQAITQPMTLGNVRRRFRNFLAHDRHRGGRINTDAHDISLDAAYLHGYANRGEQDLLVEFSRQDKHGSLLSKPCVVYGRGGGTASAMKFVNKGDDLATENGEEESTPPCADLLGDVHVALRRESFPEEV